MQGNTHLHSRYQWYRPHTTAAGIATMAIQCTGTYVLYLVLEYHGMAILEPWYVHVYLHVYKYNIISKSTNGTHHWYSSTTHGTRVRPNITILSQKRLVRSTCVRTNGTMVRTRLLTTR